MVMVGLITLPHSQTSISLPLLSSRSPSKPKTRCFTVILLQKFTFTALRCKIPREPSNFLVLAGKNEGDLSADGNGSSSGSVNGGDEDSKKDRRPIFNIKWGELLLDRDPDNIMAVALTGLLTWASVQVLWQLFFISFAILVAAVKYSFVAALLIFILITLL